MLAGLPLKLSSITVTPRRPTCSHAAPGHDADMVELVAPAPQRSRPAAWMRRQRRQRVLQAVRRAGRQAERRLACRCTSACTSQLSPLRATCVQLAHRRIRRRSERSCRSIPAPRHPIGQHQHAVVRRPGLARCSTFSRRIASRLPSFSRCTGCTFTTSATVGCVSSLSRAISPVWFMPISTTQTLAVRDGIAQRQRHAPEIVETARAGIGGGIRAARNSLVLVLPALPVRPITGPSKRARAARASVHRPSISVSLHHQLRNADAVDPVRNDHRHRAGGFAPCRQIPSRRARWRSWR